MKQTKKAIALVLCAVALVAASVFGTIAYLTDTSTVTNTFTVGNVDITLHEARVDEFGQFLDENGKVVVDISDAERVAENRYHLVPGHLYPKNPTVTVVGGSEESYIRMKVQVEDFDKLVEVFEGKTEYFNDDVFLLEKLCDGYDGTKWVFENFDDETDTYEFRYYQTVGTYVAEGSKENKDKVLEPLFTGIRLDGALFNNEQMQAIKDVKITVTAEAIQEDGFVDEEAAWAAFPESRTEEYGKTITTTAADVEQGGSQD